MKHMRIIRVEIPGETLCPHILLVLGPWPGLLQIENPPSKNNNYKMKNQGGRHQIKFATKCHAQVFFLIFIIQHVIFIILHFLNPHTPSKKIVCYKMVALSTPMEPCFTSKMAQVVAPRPLNL